MKNKTNRISNYGKHVTHMVLAGGGGRAESQWATAAVVGLGAVRGAWGGGAARTAMGHCRRRRGVWDSPR